jgi:hypothetical protein
VRAARKQSSAVRSNEPSLRTWCTGLVPREAQSVRRIGERSSRSLREACPCRLVERKRFESDCGRRLRPCPQSAP